MTKDWRLEAEKTANFHAEKQKERGIGKDGRPRKGQEKEGWSLRDTSEALRISVRQVVENLKLYGHRDYFAHKDIDRKSALFLLNNGELPKLPSREKLLHDAILSSLATLKSEGRDKVGKAIKILERGIE